MLSGDHLSDDQIRANMGAGMGGSSPRRPTRNAGNDETRFCCGCSKFVRTARQILPFMSAYVCRDCVLKNKFVPVSESEVSNKSFSPWSESQVVKLREYQASNLFLPFVCDKGHPMVPHQAGFSCNSCIEFELRWAYPWMLDGSWRNEL